MRVCVYTYLCVSVRLCVCVYIYILNLLKMNPLATVETYTGLTLLDCYSQVSDDQNGKNNSLRSFFFKPAYVLFQCALYYNNWGYV